MTSSNNIPLPPELQKALSGKPAEERDRIIRVWQLLGSLDEEPTGAPDTETALAEIERTLDYLPQSRQRMGRDRPPRTRSHNRRRWIATTTVCLIVLASVAWLWKAPVRITVPPGRQFQATLPDGSKVDINSGSRIEYARGFESWPWLDAPVRKIYVDGEAYFEVQPEGRPFVVESFNARVQALSTGFNVRAHTTAARRETVVTLSHGSVQVSAEKDPVAIAVLTREGESIRIADTDGAHIEHMEDKQLDYALAWRNKGFVVEDVPLDEAIEEIERRYAISIELENMEIQSDSINLLFTGQRSADDILQSICLALACNYRPTSEGYAIF